jgi:chromosomal replication initiator protein
MHDLVGGATRAAADLQVAWFRASDIPAANPAAPSEDLKAASGADLLLVEDLQHLPARAVEPLVRLLDRRLPRHQQVVCTASGGPARLCGLPQRLTSRLTQGLVVGLEALSPDSRQSYLRQRAEGAGLPLGADALAWLADHTPGSARQLEGALARWKNLQEALGRAPGLQEAMDAFREDAEAMAPTVERIAQRVGRYFRVAPRLMRSRQRGREALLPRQVGMYLARQLTGLSLEQIGAYFGGRDHSTVLHACRKVEQALGTDAGLGGAVRQLRADLA